MVNHRVLVDVSFRNRTSGGFARLGSPMGLWPLESGMVTLENIPIPG